MRCHSGSASTGSAIASTVAGSTVNVPRSKTGISSPSSDSAASAAASAASPQRTATASDVIAVSVFAPGPSPRGPRAPGFELGQVRRVGDAEEHADDPDRPQREVEVDLLGGQLGARRVDDVSSPRPGAP